MISREELLEKNDKLSKLLMEMTLERDVLLVDYNLLQEFKSKGYTLECPDKALEIAFRYGSIDGVHHKTWVIDQMVIDQMVRELTGDNYKEWVKNRKAGEEGLDTYKWDEGIAP